MKISLEERNFIDKNGISKVEIIFKGEFDDQEEHNECFESLREIMSGRYEEKEKKSIKLHHKENEC